MMVSVHVFATLWAITKSPKTKHYIQENLLAVPVMIFAQYVKIQVATNVLSVSINREYFSWHHPAVTVILRMVIIDTTMLPQGVWDAIVHIFI